MSEQKEKDDEEKTEEDCWSGKTEDRLNRKLNWGTAEGGRVVDDNRLTVKISLRGNKSIFCQTVLISVLENNPYDSSRKD